MPADAFAATWTDLDREVVSAGRCTGCGGCVVACPFGLLAYDAAAFRPRPRGDGPHGRCARGDTTCGVCARACPCLRDAPIHAERALHQRERRPDEPAGIIRRIVVARARDERARARGEDGGVVTGLLLWGLATGRIDGAVTAARDGDLPWQGRPLVATDAAAILAAAGSRYTYCPTPLALREAVEGGLERIALVGTGCQASLPAVMGAHRLVRWARRVVWRFGLLCSRTFTYEGLMAGRIAGEVGLDLHRLARIDIKGRVIVEADDGAVTTIPLREAAAWTRDGCRACPDFAAEHADLSFGGLDQAERRTLVLVRTETGARIWAEAVADGVVEEWPVEQRTLDLLARLAATQRGREAAAAPPASAPTRG